MKRHSSNQMRFDPRSRPSFQRFNAGDDSVRVLLVAIHRGPQPAAFLGSHPLQRLQVLLAAPGAEVDSDPLGAMTRATIGAAPQLLPQLPAADAAGARPRLVQGEILSDDDGRFYEKIGRHIRPLQRLFSGPRGEVLELPSEAPPQQRAPSPQAPDAEASKTEARAKTRLEAPPRPSPQPPFRRFSQPPFVAPPSGGRGVIREPLPPEGCTPNARRQSVPSAGGANANARRQSPPEGGTPNARCLKTAIPEQWVKPWEFQISREEAFYDMRIAETFRGAPLAFIRDLTNWFGHRQAWRKWQALLAGKSLDEQLWAVRPPKGMIARAAVRDWARQTLEQAGYDARLMLAEWEIFWRRKGL